MTQAERDAINTEWLKTVKAGDEIIISNVHDQVHNLLSGLFSNWFSSDKEQICEIHKVFGHIKSDDPDHPEDLIIINKGGDSLREVDFHLFDREGRLVPTEQTFLGRATRLVQPSDELKELSYKLKFIRDVKGNIPWERFEWKAITQIIELINGEVNRINAAHKAAEDERKCKADEAEEARKNSPFVASSNGSLSQVMTGRILNNAHPNVHRCPDCPRGNCKPEATEEERNGEEEVQSDS